MSRFSEQTTPFAFRRSGSCELTAQEQATVFAAREILSRHINRNPVLTSWQAVIDYCALSVRGEVDVSFQQVVHSVRIMGAGVTTHPAFRSAPNEHPQ